METTSNGPCSSQLMYPWPTALCMSGKCVGQTLYLQSPGHRPKQPACFSRKGGEGLATNVLARERVQYNFAAKVAKKIIFTNWIGDKNC